MIEDSGSELMRILSRFRMLKHRHMKSFGIAPAEFMMLSIVYQYAQSEDGKLGVGMQVSEVAECMGSSISACSKLIKTLEEKQMIGRRGSQSDRRKTYIFLTDQGTQCLEYANALQEKLIEHMEKEIGAEEMQNFIYTLEHIYNIIIEEMEGNGSAC